jgi:hypothetical protein
VRIDVLAAGQDQLVIAQSLSANVSEQTLLLPGVQGQVLVDIMSGERFVLSGDDVPRASNITFAPNQVRALDIL